MKYLLLVLLLSGCTNSIYPKHYAQAEEVCKPNGGIEVIWNSPYGFKVTCKNGGSFSFSKD